MGHTKLTVESVLHRLQTKIAEYTNLGHIPKLDLTRLKTHLSCRSYDGFPHRRTKTTILGLQGLLDFVAEAEMMGLSEEGILILMAVMGWDGFDTAILDTHFAVLAAILEVEDTLSCGPIREWAKIHVGLCQYERWFDDRRR
jgi:hypothetical protein